RLQPIAPSGRADAGFAAAAQIGNDEVARSEAIGAHGYAEISRVVGPRPARPVQVLTHCNAGWLAAVDWGTASDPIYKAVGGGRCPPRGRAGGSAGAPIAGGLRGAATRCASSTAPAAASGSRAVRSRTRRSTPPRAASAPA